MLRILTEEDKFDVTSSGLSQIRKRHKMPMRKKDPFGELTLPPAAGSTDPGVPIPRPTARDSRSIVQSQGAPGAVKRGRARHSTRPDGRPSRFPSELTIDEAREALGLNGEQNKAVGSLFKEIFEREASGLTKKTEIGHEKWQSMKAQLVTQNPHLRQVMRGSADELDTKSQALDIICSYVGKRLRMTRGLMGLPEARVILGMDPQEARRSREQLFQIFVDKNFAKKADLAPGEWDEINRLWAERCGKVKAALAVEPSDPKYEKTTRALKLITKNVTNRFQANVRNTTKENDVSETEESRLPAVMPSPWPALPDHGEGEQVGESLPSDEEAGNWGSDSLPDTFETNDTAPDVTSDTFVAQTRLDGPQTRQRMALRSSGVGTQGFVQSQVHFIEPVSAPRPTGPSMNSQTMGPATHDFGARFSGQYYAQQNLVHPLPVNQQHHGHAAHNKAMAAFVRLNPASTLMSNGPNLWVATMQRASVAEVHRIASQRYPGAQCSLIEGIVKDSSGTELPLRINQDNELAAYLEHLEGTAPTFCLMLN